MQTAGRILSEVVRELEPQIRIGVTTLEIDRLATKLIRQKGGEPGFMRVPSYRWATCLSVNEVVVHGIPNDYQLKDQDLLKLDIGVFYGGYHTDYGRTYYLGEHKNKQYEQFLRSGEEILAQAIKLVKKGSYVGGVSALIERKVHQAGYEILYNLTGHGVGQELHEDPLIPQFLEGKISQTPVFEEGKAYAVEIIYSMSDAEIRPAGKDGWSLRTKNRSQSAFWENTVFVTNKGTVKIVN